MLWKEDIAEDELVDLEFKNRKLIGDFVVEGGYCGGGACRFVV